MASGKSCSALNPDGIRRTVHGKTLAPRSKRKVETVIETVFRWAKIADKWIKQETAIEKKVSKVFLD